MFITIVNYVKNVKKQPPELLYNSNMHFENTFYDLQDCIDKLLDEGVENITELKHARKLAETAQKYIDAFEEFEENLDEEELMKKEDIDEDFDDIDEE